jgi:hypothetical protein
MAREDGVFHRERIKCVVAQSVMLDMRHVEKSTWHPYY